ncbi:hypothetical protein P691DRAFT_421597 [Macrolepiota fuliginosa MF-IS2]|uniref:F-box domain-containing protein n=1 Tax=Macrolepiota fuliginosa MF-IS2 TaxID=1400762 RepID=A0A9P5X296_9AGAR|nr:hypothetical protein P691DRAFT_421597 [Macrolepiota fuliginosa MF-IS2]
MDRPLRDCGLLHNRESPLAGEQVACPLKHSESPLDRSGEVRGATLREVNAGQSATRSLPLEILGHVFMFACPSVNILRENEEEIDWQLESRVPTSEQNPYFAVALSSLSTHWRAAALSAVSLWTSMELEVQEVKLRQQIAILCLYLSHAKNVPFSLKLSFTEQRKADCDTQRSLQSPLPTFSPQHLRDLICPEIGLDPLRHLIFIESAEKFGTLYLHSAPPEWLASISPSLSKLEHIVLWWNHNDSGPVPRFIGADLGGLSRLRSISISKIPTIRPIPSSVTAVYLQQVPADVCAQILVECPHLVELICSYPAGTGLWHLPPPVWLRQPLVCERLTHFGWTSLIFGGWERAIMQHVRLPVLEHLEWGPWNTDADVMLQLFFHNLGNTLISLALDNSSISDPASLDAIFNCTPNLQYLRFSHVMDTVLPVLFWTLTPEQPSSSTPFPYLEEVGLVDIFGQENVSQTHLCEIFLEFVQAWRLRGMDYFVLDIWNYDFEWSPEVCRELVDIVEDGFDLSIFQDDKEVQWLSRSPTPSSPLS